MEAWPIEEALLRPAAALALSALVPFATAALLRWVYLGELPASGEERRRRLVPFRRAAFVVGLGQQQLAWMLGATSLGPTLAPDRGWACAAFGGLAAVVAFLSGGVARRVEEPADARSTVLGTLALRLRLVPLVAGPVLVALAAARLPVVGEAGAVRWGWAAAALALVLAGTAFGGLLLSLATFALRPASPEVRALAREVAAREGASLLMVLRLPTRGARFANAAALPWARTLIVADRTVALLDRDELGAVLAHEAGHLTEGPRVALARLGSAAILLYTVAVGPSLAFTLPEGAAYGVLAAALFAGLLLVLSVRRLARRMEERADARAAETAGPAPLAAALRRLHDNAEVPMVLGRGRIHPDLHDRLVALGEEPGPRPAPPPKGGALLGASVAVGLVALPVVVHALTDVEPSEIREVSEPAAAWRLRIEPFDREAVLALAWHARRADHLGLAAARADLAARMGPDDQSYLLLRAELHAALGECAEARDAFERSLEAQAEELFDQGAADAEIALGDYGLPPSLVRGCDLTVGDAFGEPGEGEMRFRVEPPD